MSDTQSSNVSPLTSVTRPNGTGPDSFAVMARAQGPNHRSEFTDARLAERVAVDRIGHIGGLADRFRWARGLNWLRWDGMRWAEVADVEVTEHVRAWVLAQYVAASRQAAKGDVEHSLVDKWHQTQGKNKIAAIVALARGVPTVLARADDFDTHPDLLNTPAGVVDLRTGALTGHDPSLLLTKITKGGYRPGYRHPDWTAALEAIDEPARSWFQVVIGQGITGHRTPDGRLIVMQGGGNNGKSLLTTDGLVPALGDYADVASPKLFTGSKDDHSTERADLRGTRLLIAEEMAEQRAINVTALKRIMDVGRIKARYTHQDNITFTATHSLLATSNYRPVVAETDHGTWRRLGMLPFPYLFVAPPEGAGAGWQPDGERERRGDPTLKSRIEHGQDQADAAVTWAVEGAIRWHADRAGSLAMPTPVVAATREWRSEADRIMAFWDEQLTPDADASVLTSEVLEVFNDWMRANGHNPWPKETFGSRFPGHSETQRHRIVRQRPREPRGLRRHPKPGMRLAVPARPEVWVGLRYRTPEDDSEGAVKAVPGAAAALVSGAQNGAAEASWTTADFFGQRPPS